MDVCGDSNKKGKKDTMLKAPESWLSIHSYIGFLRGEWDGGGGTEVLGVRVDFVYIYNSQIIWRIENTCIRYVHE